MAESTLSLGYVDFANAVCDELRWGRDYASRPQSDRALIHRLVQDGYRMALNPDATDHNWSFLRPVRTIVTTPPYATGTVTIEQPTPTVVTLSGGTWPEWAANGVLRVRGAEYEVASRDSNTQITLSTPAEAVSAAPFSMPRRYYDLEDDFGAIEGPITYPPHVSCPPIRLVSEASLRVMRQEGRPIDGRPHSAAVTWVVRPSSSGQRARIEFFPTASATWLLTYRCRILCGELNTTHPYPVGGMEFARLVMAACLAAAESYRHGGQGPRYQEYMAALTPAVAADRRREPERFSYFGGRGLGDADAPYAPHYVTYNGYPF